MPRSGIELLGRFHSRRNTSCTISSASVGVAEQPPGQAEHRAGVAAVGLGQRVLLVAADRHDEDRRR